MLDLAKGVANALLQFLLVKSYKGVSHFDFIILNILTVLSLIIASFLALQEDHEWFVRFLSEFYNTLGR